MFRGNYLNSYPKNPLNNACFFYRFLIYWERESKQNAVVEGVHCIAWEQKKEKLYSSSQKDKLSSEDIFKLF